MKIISWNCKKHYNSKAKLLFSQGADLVIISECERPEFLNFDADDLKPTDYIWYGHKSAGRGIGIFSYGNYKIELLDIHNEDIKYVVPISVCNNGETFSLLAVWTHQTYTKQMWNAIKHYENLLGAEIIIIGDFNSNTKWDSTNKGTSHSEFVNHLETLEIYSLYHLFKNEKQGSETLPTFHWYHHEDKPFHIDYCFASKNFVSKLTNVEIGKFKDWAKHSDHMPLTITFNDN